MFFWWTHVTNVDCILHELTIPRVVIFCNWILTTTTTTTTTSINFTATTTHFPFNNYVACQIYLSSVWVRLSIFSPLSIVQSIIQHVGLCVLSLPTPIVMIEIIYILCLIIIIKSEVWTITHCLGLGHETMVCAVCLSIFLSQYPHTFQAVISGMKKVIGV